MPKLLELYNLQTMYADSAGNLPKTGGQSGLFLFHTGMARTAALSPDGRIRIRRKTACPGAPIAHGAVTSAGECCGPARRQFC